MTATLTQCRAAVCERTAKKRGMCNMHYNRWLRGHPEDGNRRVRPSCTFLGCGRPNSSRGLCASHTWQREHGHKLTAIGGIMAEECTFGGCHRAPRRRGPLAGLCRAHAEQKKSGRQLAPLTVFRDATDEEGFWERVNKTDGCWEWMGSITSAGYGNLRFPGARYGYAHRRSWELARGPIPEGLTIDHLCRNTRCVNPDHLEPVTQAENNRRAREAKKAVA